MYPSSNIEPNNDRSEFKLYYDPNNPRQKLIATESQQQECFIIGWIYERSSSTAVGLGPLARLDMAMMERDIEQLGYHIYTQPRIMQASKTSF